MTLPDGRSSEIKIAVNHPAKVGSWWIYQSDYLSDTERGEFASIFKCVCSPLSEVFRIALWLLLVSAAAMVFFAGFKPSFGKKGPLSVELQDGAAPLGCGTFNEKEERL